MKLAYILLYLHKHFIEKSTCCIQMFFQIHCEEFENQIEFLVLMNNML
jgi:hypothetical protein